MNRKSNIGKLLAFVFELEKLQHVKREIYRKDGSQENDAEHSWHVAMMVLVLGKEIDPKADINKMLKMALMHDLVEIYAGDTFLFDTAGQESKQKRELEAAKKLFELLPTGVAKDFWQLFEEFEALETPEAKIVKSIDYIQPLVHQTIHDGASYKRHQLTFAAHDKKKRPKMVHNKVILEIFDRLSRQSVEKNIFYEQNK